MIKLLICPVLLFGMCLSPLSGQDFSRKFGKITDYEVDMTSYEQDTSAVAVYLYEETVIKMYQPGSSTNADRLYSVKIKILKPEGVSLANVGIPYRSRGERISDMEATAYNRVDDKIEETRLNRNDAVTEKVTDNVSLYKFSIPNVREGSVIEYKYRTSSSNFTLIDPIRIQHDHPVVYSYSKVDIPDALAFNVNTTGGYRPLAERTKKGRSYIYTITGEDIPALKPEPFVWCEDDFETKVTFELRSANIPGTPIYNFSGTWEKVDQTLEQVGFDKHLGMRNPLRKEVDQLTSDYPDERERVRAILKLVLDRMNWNGQYRILPNEPHKRLDEGSGSSADINFILNAALRGAGFTTTPILLAPRRYGRLPLANPSVDNLRTFVLLVTLSDGKNYVVDGTDPSNDINLIPVELMVDRARIYGADNASGWINLSALTPNIYRILVTCTLNETGLTGDMTRFVQNARTYGLKNSYRNAGSEDKYVESLETDYGMTISSYAIENFDTSQVTEKIDFTMGVESAGDFIYLNAPVIDFLTTNLLTRQERVRPVEFPYPEKASLTVVMTLPEGYELEEAPEPLNISACNHGVEYLYQALWNGDQLVVKVDLNINTLLYMAEEYPDLFEFFGLVAEKGNAHIILKKTR